jgi:hypothetical protein
MTKLKIATSLLGATLLAVSPAMAANYSFQTLNNSADPNFNQLLGINNSGTTVGYDGDGAVVPNMGYSLKNGAYSNENFPGSAQTQVIGINSGASPTTVGFYVDGLGNNFGFVNQGGTFTSVSNPNTPSGTTVNQLLGVDNSNIAAGFYVDGGGNAQGYLYNIGSQSFTAITDPIGVATTAAGINNSGVVTGFYTDAGGATHGFLDIAGIYTSFDDPNGTNTMFFGINNVGGVVGSYMDTNGVNEGLVYDYLTNTWQTVDDPNNSANAAFGVTGTFINGINDNGQLVGFYSDGTNVDGFSATATPEPASIGLISLGLLGAGLVRRRKRS